MAPTPTSPDGAPPRPGFWLTHGSAIVVSFCVTFAVIFGGFVCYAPNATREYVSKASVQVYLATPSPAVVAAPGSAAGAGNNQDFNTLVRLMQSETIARRVADRLKSNPQQLKDFLQPYQNASASATDESVIQHLMEHEMVTPVSVTLVIDVSFEHPNKEIAAVITEYFAQEFIAYDQELDAKKAMAIGDDLQNQANAIQKSINDIQSKIRVLAEKYPGLVGPINSAPPEDVKQEYETLNHQLEDAQSNYKQQMLKIQQLFQAVRSSTANIVMVDHANVPAQPASPKIPFLLAAGFVSGVIGGTVVAGLVALILHSRWSRRSAQ